jgi:putative transcriptional regulator
MAVQRLRNTLKVQRAKLDLTQEQLAERVGVTRKTVNSIESQHFIPSTLLALRLARTLQVTVEELFLLDDESINVTVS